MTKYHLVESTIKTGDLLACNGKWFMSRAIQWYTGHMISHVGVACWIAFNGTAPTLCMFEAMEGRDVRIVPVEKVLRSLYWPTGGKMFHKSLLQPYNGKELMDFCVEHWNNAYADTYQFILGISPRLRYLRTLLGKSLDTDANKYHCSELIASGLKEQDHVWDKECALLTPGELYDSDAYASVGTELEFCSTKQIQAIRQRYQRWRHSGSGH